MTQNLLLEGSDTLLSDRAGREVLGWETPGWLVLAAPLPRLLHKKSGSHHLSSKPQSLWMPHPPRLPPSSGSQCRDTSPLGAQPGTGGRALTERLCRGGTSLSQKRWGWAAPAWATDPEPSSVPVSRVSVRVGVSPPQCGLLVWNPVAPIRCLPRSKATATQMWYCMSSGPVVPPGSYKFVPGDCLYLFLKSFPWRTASGHSSPYLTRPDAYSLWWGSWSFPLGPSSRN